MTKTVEQLAWKENKTPYRYIELSELRKLLADSIRNCNVSMASMLNKDYKTVYSRCKKNNRCQGCQRLLKEMPSVSEELKEADHAK
jgi:hypothetical protein